MQNPVRVALLGRNAIVREGLRRILADDHFEVTQSVDHHSRLHDIQSQEDRGSYLIVMDNGVDQTEMTSIRTLQQRFPDARLVMLSDQFDFDTMAMAFRMGVHGYIVKEISCAPLIGSLQLVAMGEKVMPTQLADELPSQASSFYREDCEKSLVTANLSGREIEILRCLIMGYPNKIVSRRLQISEATVKVHVKAILRKLRVQNRTQAAIWAVNRGMEGTAQNAPVLAPVMTAQIEAPAVAASSVAA